MKPRVLFVSRRVETPLPAGERRKWDAVRRELDFRILAAGTPDGAEFPLFSEPPLLAGPAYYAALPARIARELRRFRPQAVVAQGAHETAAALTARRLAGVETAVIADVHGDFRAPTRLYGSRLRGVLNVVADRTARTALRRADGIRTVTGYTTGLVRDLGLEPADEFPAYMDFESFLQSPPAPLPERPQALFVGVLERYKNVDGLGVAWRGVATSVPEARLRIVGTGTLAHVVEELVAEVPGVEWSPRLSQEDVAAALDESTCLVLPSRSEGMGRVVVEAFCRGRAVVGARAGGIPDIVHDGENGLLVQGENPQALAEAMVRLVTEPGLAAKLGQGAYDAASQWTATPAENARRTRELVETVLGR